MCSVKKADLINVYMFVLDDIKKNNKQSNVVLLVVVTLQVWGLHSCVTSHHAANSWAPTPLNTPTTRQIYI